MRIVRSPMTYGSGDVEDPPEVAHDRDVPCFYILYQTCDGQEVGGGGHPSLEEAMSDAMKLLGESVVWER